MLKDMDISKCQCHKSGEIWIPSVAKSWPPSWKTVWPSEKGTGLGVSQSWGSYPSCTLNGHDLGSDTKSLLLSLLICDRDHTTPTPNPMYLWTE